MSVGTQTYTCLSERGGGRELPCEADARGRRFEETAALQRETETEAHPDAEVAVGCVTNVEALRCVSEETVPRYASVTPCDIIAHRPDKTSTTLTPWRCCAEDQTRPCRYCAATMRRRCVPLALHCSEVGAAASSRRHATSSLRGPAPLIGDVSRPPRVRVVGERCEHVRAKECRAHTPKLVPHELGCT